MNPLKNQRRWQNAENYNFTNGQLTRSGNFGIKHNQEQVGDRQTFTFKHTLFGLDSQTVAVRESLREHADDPGSAVTEASGGWGVTWARVTTAWSAARIVAALG